MTMTPEELRNDLDAIGDPPDVSDLISGSGIAPQNGKKPCDQVDCEAVADRLTVLQDWLGKAQERLRELDNYNNTGLKRIIDNARFERDAAEQTGGDGSAYQDILDAATAKQSLARTNWNELNDQIDVELSTKQAWQSTHYHCCTEPWYKFW